MKKAIISILLAVAMLTTMTGCSYMKYIKKVEEARQRDAEEQAKMREEMEAEEQRINDALNAANNSTDNDSSSGSEDEGGAETEFYFDLNLDSADPYGNRTMTEDMVAGAKVVMINFWEPWCGPCVGELPDLELLYENYKNKGLVVIGAYTTIDMPDDVTELVEGFNITYPVITATEDTYSYMTEYVPTTCFFTAEGLPFENSQYIGAHSYEEWAEIVESLLEKAE